MEILQGIGLILVGVFFGALFRDHQRRQNAQATMSPRHGGQYAPRPLLCERRAAMVDKLAQAFPEYRVLVFVPASHLLSLHGGGALPQRRDVLRQHVLDFVVVDGTGVPRYIFTIGSERDTYSLRTQNREQAFIVWALKKAGIPTFRISSLDSRVGPAQLRSSVGLYSTDLPASASGDAARQPSRPDTTIDMEAVVRMGVSANDTPAAGKRQDRSSAKTRGTSVWPISGAS
jgi:hypothetical protein